MSGHAATSPQLLTSDASVRAPSPLKVAPKAPDVEAAAKWLREADAVLIVAGAGLSAAPGQNVYVDEGDFEAHYPAMARKWGVRTAYEAMGMAQLGVPKEVVAGFYAKHCHNMYYRFEPNEGYAALKRLVAGKDHFVLTSNVDGMFQKAGFDASRIYTPQGEMRYHQCQRSPPCTRETWDSRALYERLIPQLDAETMALRPRAMAEMRCPGGCGGRRGPNLRGSASFVHQRYQAAQDRLAQFVEGVRARGGRLAVVEVGAGFNSPTVTRFPGESIARDVQGALIRINPEHYEVPTDLERAVGIPRGWDALLDLEEAEGAGDAAVLAARGRARDKKTEPELHEIFASHYGHFDWQEMLYDLTDEARAPAV